MPNFNFFYVGRFQQKWMVIAILVCLGSQALLLSLDPLWIDEMWAADLTGSNIFPKLFIYHQFTTLSESLQKIITQIYGLGAAAQIVLRSAISDTSPPAYYLFMHLWTSIFGISEVSLRMPSLIFQFGTLLLILAIAGNIKSKFIAFLLASFVMSNSLQVYIATDARPYALYQFLILLYLFFLVNELKAMRRNWSRMAGIFAAATLAMYTHYMACLFVIAGLILVFQQKIITDNGIAWRTWLPSIAALATFSFWVPVILLQASKTGRLGYLATFDLTALSDLFFWACPFSVFGNFSGTTRFWIGLLVATLWAIASIWVWRIHATEDIFKVICWLIVVQIAVVILIFFACLIKPIYNVKNFSVLSILTPLPILTWLQSRNSKIINNLMAICATFFLTASCGFALYGVNIGSYYMVKPEWDKAANFVSQISYPYNKILINPQFERSPFMYYFKRDGYSIDESRASKVLESNNVQPLYEFERNSVACISDHTLQRMYGDRLVLVDGDNNPPNLWKRQGFDLVQEFKGVRVYTSDPIP